MKTTEEIFQILKNNFPDSELNLKTDIPLEQFIIISPFDIDKIALFLRDNPDLQFDSLMCLSGVDDFNGQKIKDESGTEVMQGGTLSVYYHLESTSLRHKLVLKTSTSRENPEVVSVSEIWQAANWHEREAYDMFGIKFLNHPDLRRILMPYDWEFGYPLRKDYQNPEFYQGMKVPY
ncbi:NADH dehydrogenase I subunit C [Ignavibacterium album JCM 16511]|uniref:NADH-quinone oxidoreductase subunit C n=1 Tax=Ignavibacterium album (strain DSM 19864 / JCM 16511 / NBRC 101810 / Mat9-16) TaxID=945713 RepID=I0AK25_IGNAJ|nr:NADH-quinone oxidoreductase subunit C [Ignavibacterium album]AFH49332.1 NADH dehydrogenase I subunit C [Ignavibacterium album JCM 16511]